MIAEMDRLEIVCLREALPEVVAFLQSRGRDAYGRGGR